MLTDAGVRPAATISGRATSRNSASVSASAEHLLAPDRHRDGERRKGKQSGDAARQGRHRRHVGRLA